MKIYLSGPMTGLPDFNHPAFNSAALSLRRKGYNVVNPVELDSSIAKEWTDYMRTDIKALCDCTAIVVLPGWEKSRGATLEVFIGTQLGMSVLSMPQALGYGA